MALPINIDNLIHARTVESARLEFKKGWNPEEVLRTICAFSNDINEFGESYIIIGIEEQDGKPILPPIGVPINQIDKIQKEFINLCYEVKPNISPIIDPTEFMGQYIVIIWVTTGEERPYSAPSTLGVKGQRKIYIRQGSASIPANTVQEKKLRELGANLQFDDTINVFATINDLDLGLIQAYLQESKSKLYEESLKLSIEEIAIKMQIARGPKGNKKPLNVGLMMFSKEPHRFFQGCITNLIEFEDEEGAKIGATKEFKGPIHIQIRDILDYFNSNIVKNYTNKSTLRAESEVFRNYPFLALREAIVNAFYHRGYDDPMPNEIRIYKGFNRGMDKIFDPRRIEVRSFPGPMAPIDERALADLKITDRRSRNLLLGNMLKQIGLTEKFATGIPQMLLSLNQNGSPKPILSTDQDRLYFLTVLKIHESTPISPEENQILEKILLSDSQQDILDKCLSEPHMEEELEILFTKNFNSDISYLLAKKLINIKNVNNSKLYYITDKGRVILKHTF